MDAQTIKERVAEIEVKRESLVRLLDRSDFGSLENRCESGDRRN